MSPRRGICHVLAHQQCRPYGVVCVSSVSIRMILHTSQHRGNEDNILILICPLQAPYSPSPLTHDAAASPRVYPELPRWRQRHTWVGELPHIPKSSAMKDWKHFCAQNGTKLRISEEMLVVWAVVAAAANSVVHTPRRNNDGLSAILPNTILRPKSATKPGVSSVEKRRLPGAPQSFSPSVPRGWRNSRSLIDDDGGGVPTNGSTTSSDCHRVACRSEAWR